MEGLNEALGGANIDPLNRQIAEQSFKTGAAPLEEAFERQNISREEQLAARGVSLGGLGNESRQRLFKAQDEVLGRLAGSVAGSALERAFASSEAAKGREFSRETAKQQNLFGLAQAGQLQGSALDAALEPLGLTAQTFLTTDQASMKREADRMGMTVAQFQEGQRLLGDLLQEDIRKHPERYAGLAEDPDAVFRKQKQIARASRPSKGKKSHFCIAFYERGLITTRQLWQLTNRVIVAMFTRGDFTHWYMDNADAIAQRATAEGFDWSTKAKEVDFALHAYRTEGRTAGDESYMHFCKWMSEEYGDHVAPFKAEFFEIKPVKRFIGSLKILFRRSTWSTLPEVLISRIRSLVWA